MPKSGQPWNPEFLINEPLFGVFEGYARPLRTSVWPSLDDYARHLEDFRPKNGTTQVSPLGVAHAPKRARRSQRTNLALEGLYDGRIALKREVFCLSQSYHDLFNIIVFSAFPLAKRALHERQFRALTGWVPSGQGQAAPRLPGRRTREQDALTIFDEGGVVLAMTEAARSAFITAGATWEIAAFAPESEVVPILFGHALLEHLFERHLTLRASALILPMPRPVQELRRDTLCRDLDPLLCERIQTHEAFVEPRADCIFEMHDNGRLTARRPRLAPQSVSPQTSP